MLKNQIKNKFLIPLLMISLGIGAGYYLSPSKVEIKERVVTKTKVVVEETKRVTENFHPKTGKVLMRTTETGTKKQLDNSKDKSKEKKIERNKKQWAVKVGTSFEILNPTKQIPRVGAEMRLPIFDSWIGTEFDVDINKPKMGVYLRLEL